MVTFLDSRFLLYFVTESECRSRCLRFLLFKVLVVSLIIDFFRSHSFRALYFWSCAQMTAGSNVLGSFSAFCYKFCEQVTTGANVRFLVYHHWFCAKVAAEAIAIFFLCILSLILCANDCESSDDFAGNCIREDVVCRPSVCLIFSLILRKWLRELAFLLDHFTSFNWNCFSLVFIRFSCCFPFWSKQM